MFYLQELCLEICCAEGKCSGCHISLSLQNTPQSNETTVCGKGLFEYAIFACRGTLFLHYKKPATVLVRTDSSLDLLNSPGNFQLFPIRLQKKSLDFSHVCILLTGACMQLCNRLHKKSWIFHVALTHRVVHAVMQWIIPKGLDISCWDILHTDFCMQLCNRLYRKSWIFLVWVSYSWVCACSYAMDYTKRKCVVVIILLFKIRYDFQVCKVMGIVNLFGTLVNKIKLYELLSLL